MVVGLALAAIQMGMALPTGFLFGVGYGTGVRIGYEQVYPLLFPKGARHTTSELAATMKGMNTVYDAIGGKDASRMGIAVGITNAGEILKNPDFRVLEKLESSSSGPTSSNSNRLASGRGSLDLSDKSSEEIFGEEIEQFNIDTGREKLARYRGYSITQLRNLIISTKNAESKRIALAVLDEKLQQDQGTGTPTILDPIPGQPTGSVETRKFTENAEFLKWNKDLNYHLERYTTMKRLDAPNISGTLYQRAGVLGRSGAKKAKLASSNYIFAQSRLGRHPNNQIRITSNRLRTGWWR